MDFKEVKQIIIAYHWNLTEQNIYHCLLLLFGSYAKGTACDESDIDLAVVSRSFGHDRFSESVLLNKIAAQTHHKLQIVPVSLTEYMDSSTISPIVAEIQATGAPII